MEPVRILCHCRNKLSTLLDVEWATPLSKFRRWHSRTIWTAFVQTLKAPETSHCCVAEGQVSPILPPPKL